MTIAAPSKTRLYLEPIVILAFALRLTVAFLTLRNHPAAWFFHQATELGELAHSLVTTHSLRSPFGGNTGPSAFLAPGYPLFIALIFKLFGSFTSSAAEAIVVLQSVFGALTVFVLMRLGQRLGGTLVANVAGIIWAVSPPLVALPTVFWETSLSILLLTAIVAFTLRSYERPALHTWLALGALCLIALYTNPSLALATLACLAWLILSAARKRAPILLTVAVLLLFTPWPIRNLRVMHAFIPLRDNLGYELWQGNRPGADGFFDATLHPNNNVDEFNRFRALGELGYMRDKGDQARETIRSMPVRFLGFTAIRVACFWTGAGRQSSWPMTFYTTLTAAFGFAGLWMLFEEHKKTAILLAIPLALLPIPYYITHPDYRFRCVIDPLLTLLTAYALLSWSGHESIPPDTVPSKK